MGFSGQEIGAGCRALLESEVQLTRFSAGFLEELMEHRGLRMSWGLLERLVWDG